MSSKDKNNNTSVEQMPLAGIRVLEFSHAVMGPSCGLILADLGAEVIKVEPSPEGDPTRKLKGFGLGFFTFFNRNKKSLAINLKTEEGLKFTHQLVKKSDVLIENYGPGTMDRLGLGYKELNDLNNQLIYCSLKGFMPGPYEKRVALDEIVQMMSGLAYMTGPPGRPLRAGASVVDIMGGTYGALGILVALRERDHTGKGQLIQNGLFETAAFLMGQHMAYSAISETPLPPMPARVSAWAIYQVFDTREGDQVFVGVTSDKHWVNFCNHFDRPDLLEDERLATNNQRIAERDWLLPNLEKMIIQLSKQEILEKCEKAKIPFAEIAEPVDLFDNPHLNQAGALASTLLPDGKESPLPLLPLKMNGKWMQLRKHPPAVGQDTRELLSQMNYSQIEIEHLLDEGIIKDDH